jgi:cobalt/nickel transport system permease protein
VRCVSLILRSWLAVQVAILLTGTTPTDWIFWSLRALRAPGILVAVVRFAYRYLALMADEARRMLRARAARSARLAGRPSLAWQGTVTGAMAGSLFVRSLERSERVYAAMLARGYDGRIRMAASPQMQRRDWLMLALAAVGLTVLVMVIGR